ncbi:hypothetical protein NL676_005700 [Syzygium grande]|nr:hypothetical protein NL676_005700 [Syzygium grande]
MGRNHCRQRSVTRGLQAGFMDLCLCRRMRKGQRRVVGGRWLAGCWWIRGRHCSRWRMVPGHWLAGCRRISFGKGRELCLRGRGLRSSCDTRLLGVLGVAPCSRFKRGVFLVATLEVSVPCFGDGTLCMPSVSPSSLGDINERGTGVNKSNKKIVQKKNLDAR